ncbi:MAG: hypothetical protein NTV87_06625 [Ignavibacteriae bacterium]|nr:hypothetical protein [Ignavibacteriota bacterium]
MKTLIIVISLLIAVNMSLAQKKEIIDDNYKFQISLPADWKERIHEETKNKDAISYTFDRKDKKLSMLIIAFKLDAVKDINDLIYMIEKDINLNIPSRTGEYSDIQGEKFKGKIGEYKDMDFTETIYYIGTINTETTENYAYMIRFICDSKFNNPTVKNDITSIIESFKINL